MIPILPTHSPLNYNNETMNVRPRGRQRVTPDMARAMNSLRRIVRAGRGATQVIESRFGISSAQFYVLQTLAESPGMSIKDLVSVTLTTNSSVSEVVGRLVDAGLVIRDTSAEDRRRKVLTLTDEGQEIARHSPRTIQRDLIEGFSRLPAHDQRALADSLEEWCRRSGFGDVPATMLFEPDTSPVALPTRKRPAKALSSPRR